MLLRPVASAAAAHLPRTSAVRRAATEYGPSWSRGVHCSTVGNHGRARSSSARSSSPVRTPPVDRFVAPSAVVGARTAIRFEIGATTGVVITPDVRCLSAAIILRPGGGDWQLAHFQPSGRRVAPHELGAACRAPEGRPGLYRRYQRTAIMITSGGKRNPPTRELGADTRTSRRCISPACPARSSANATVRANMLIWRQLGRKPSALHRRCFSRGC